MGWKSEEPPKNVWLTVKEEGSGRVGLGRWVYSEIWGQCFWHWETKNIPGRKPLKHDSDLLWGNVVEF